MDRRADIPILKFCKTILFDDKMTLDIYINSIFYNTSKNVGKTLGVTSIKIKIFDVLQGKYFISQFKECR